MIWTALPRRDHPDIRRRAVARITTTLSTWVLLVGGLETGDGELATRCVRRGSTPLADGGTRLLTPKAGSSGHVEADDIAEARPRPACRIPLRRERVPRLVRHAAGRPPRHVRGDPDQLIRVGVAFFRPLAVRPAGFVPTVLAVTRPPIVATWCVALRSRRPRRARQFADPVQSQAWREVGDQGRPLRAQGPAHVTPVGCPAPCAKELSVLVF